MTKLILALALTITTQSAFAAKQSVETLAELCALDLSSSGEGPTYEANFTEVRSVNVKEAAIISATELNMINQHLIHEQYYATPMTFAEIKALFTTGEQSYNDLYLITFKSNATGRVYTQVKSYPGENPYGLIFDVEQKAVAAFNGDDNITLNADSGAITCYDLMSK